MSVHETARDRHDQFTHDDPVGVFDSVDDVITDDYGLSLFNSRERDETRQASSKEDTCEVVNSTTIHELLGTGALSGANDDTTELLPSQLIETMDKPITLAQRIQGMLGTRIEDDESDHRYRPEPFPHTQESIIAGDTTYYKNVKQRDNRPPIAPPLV